jgi:hypothetical protein
MNAIILLIRIAWTLDDNGYIAFAIGVVLFVLKIIFYKRDAIDNNIHKK